MEDWKITDPDTGQKGRRLSTYKFEFSENGRTEIIDLEDYGFKQICNLTEAYYPNLDELFALYGADSCWIIAECIFEATEEWE
jgi:hypothetical protein